MHYKNKLRNRDANTSILVELAFLPVKVILIVALAGILIILLNILSSSGQYLNTTCLATSGFACRMPSINTTGQLSFVFIQNNGNTFYNVSLSCSEEGNSHNYLNYSLIYGPFYATNSSGNTVYVGKNSELIAKTDVPVKISNLHGAAVSIVYPDISSNS